MKRRRRWSDHDRYWGPFTFAHSKNPWGSGTFEISLNSGYDEYPGNHLLLRGFSWTVIVELPDLIAPYRERVYPREWKNHEGRTYYDNEYNRRYGFYSCEGHFNVMYGRESNDSKTEQRWSTFLPWTQWRHVRQSWYGLAGEHLASVYDADERLGTGPSRWEREREIAERTPTVAFTFLDYDGEPITATTKIEEREWRFGTGWCRWLSWFRRPMIKRSLDIQFSAEVGPRKGSWKGGTLGHSIQMLPGELHRDAFLRYAEKYHLKDVTPVEVSR
jgi:hypothetical protein